MATGSRHLDMNVHDHFALDESREVDEEERSDSVQMISMATSPNSSSGSGHQAQSTDRGRGSWQQNTNDNDNEVDDEEDDDADEYSELRQQRQGKGRGSGSRTGGTGLAAADGGESGLLGQSHIRNGGIVSTGEDEDAEINEKSFRYYRDLPEYSKLKDANKKIPGVRVIGAGLALLAGIGYLISFLVASTTRYAHATKVNVILMVSDGYGPASETFARSYLQHLISVDDPLIMPQGRWAALNPANDDSSKAQSSSSSDPRTSLYGVTLPLDRILIGQSRTRSSDSLVTDSAAGATAFSCGMKSYNGAIAVEPEKRNPCGTVLEAAKHQGYRTGLVVTSRITHATPAAFYAHVPDRDMEDVIAEQMITTHPLGSQVDLAFGGGLCFFLPKSSSSSCRNDEKDLIAASKDKSNKMHPYNIITTRKEFDAVPGDASALGTVALLGTDHLEYEIDRWKMAESEDDRQPSLEDMAVKAIDILQSSAQASSAHGFFLMIEGSRIDMAGHGNDPVGHVHEILSYQSTVKRVLEKVDDLNEAGTPTMLVSVSDHETGGLSLAYQLTGTYPEYAWYPDALINGTATAFSVARQVRAQTDIIDEQALRKLLQSDLGVSDPDQDELASILDNKDVDVTAELWTLSHVISKLTSRRAQVGWSTEGHSGVDVNLYGYPRSLVSPTLGGNRENTEIGYFIADTMKLDLKQITKSLSNNLASWYSSTSAKLNDPSRNHSTLEVQHYHGAHRH